jgi:hypothetical protein
VSFIRIISIPPGEAPERVRKEWVGLELPLSENVPPGVEVGALGGPPENSGGYPVDTAIAMKALRVRSRAAAEWWEDNVTLTSVSHLVFDKAVCQLIE